MVKKIIATTAGALFLVGQTAAAMAAPALPASAQRIDSTMVKSQQQMKGSDWFWIVLFMLIAAGVIVLVQNNSNNTSDAPASP